jgi:hypothetical protein
MYITFDEDGDILVALVGGLCGIWAVVSSSSSVIMCKSVLSLVAGNATGGWALSGTEHAGK